MHHWFSRLSIFQKLLTGFGFVIGLSVLLGVFTVVGFQKLLSYHQLNSLISNQYLVLHQVDETVNYFLLEGYKEPSVYTSDKEAINNKLDSLFLLLNNGLAQSASQSKRLGLNASILIDQAVDQIAEYDSLVHEVARLMIIRGFKDYGLEGKLREAIHNIEDHSDNLSLVDVLMLRRHEKDFMLRKDKKYLTSFDILIQRMQSTLDSSASTHFILAQYKDSFTKLVAIEEEMGLKADQGKKGELVRLRSKLFETFDNASIQLTDEVIQLKQYTLWATVVSMILLLGFGGYFAFTFSNLLSSRINDVKNAMQTLSNGSYPEQLKIVGTDEIAETREAMNQLIARIQQAGHYAVTLGAGNLDMKYDSKYNNDVLAKAIIGLQEKLKTAAFEQQITNWTNEGLATINEILNTTGRSTDLWPDILLKHLVQYLQCNQAALYVIDNQHGNSRINRIATYAYGRKKYLDQAFDMGEGLVGQCVLEKDILFLSDVPKNYVKITSGLGEALPRCVVICPLMDGDSVYGAIELASFKIFESHELSFIKKISESIASLIRNQESNQKIQYLLKETTERATQLGQQEEELRQTTEELRAVQEALEQENALLRKQISERNQLIS